MWEKQIYELLDKLSQINYEELDIDDFLDQRDSDPFDSEWVRVYQALEELKKGKTVADTREIEKKAYITVYEKSENDELAGYISDDFGLIADSKRLGYSDKWLEKLISCYLQDDCQGFSTNNYSGYLKNHRDHCCRWNGSQPLFG